MGLRLMKSSFKNWGMASGSKRMVHTTITTADIESVKPKPKPKTITITITITPETEWSVHAKTTPKTKATATLESESSVDAKTTAIPVFELLLAQAKTKTTPGFQCRKREDYEKGVKSVKRMAKKLFKDAEKENPGILDQMRRQPMDVAAQLKYFRSFDPGY